MTTIIFPTSVSVPKSGCSKAQEINIKDGSLPGVLNIRISTENTGMYFGDTASNIITLDSSTIYPVPFTLCSDDTVAVKRIYNPKILFTGESSPVVQGNVNSINAIITDVPLPVFTVENPMTDTASGQLFSNISVKSNVNGKLYYTIKETDESFINVSLSALKTNISANKLVIQSQSDFIGHIYDSPRDVRVGVIDVSAGNTAEITMWQYFPQTNYLLCGYVQTNDKKSVSNLTCSRIVTPPESDNHYYIIFSLVDPKSQMSDTDRQSILCYWQGYVPTESSAFVTNLRGERCDDEGLSPLYVYKG